MVVPLAFSGCGITAVVTDFQNGKSEVKHVKVAPLEKRIKILDGDAVRVIELRHIERISFFPAGARTFEGSVYYQTGILLKDGTQIGYSTEDTVKHADAFICVDGALSGETKKGVYSISFDKVMEIEIED